MTARPGAEFDPAVVDIQSEYQPAHIEPRERDIMDRGQTIQVREIRERYSALGLAIHYLSRRRPFSEFRVPELVRTIDAQIVRRHALFALGPMRVEGYIGWALYDLDVARRFAATGVAPPDEMASGNDVVWILSTAAESRQALDILVRTVKAKYPAWRAMGIRHRPNGKMVVFDQRIGHATGPA